MPETKKRPLDTMGTGENSGESKGEHKKVHDFQIRDIMNCIAYIQNTFKNLANFMLPEVSLYNRDLSHGYSLYFISMCEQCPNPFPGSFPSIYFHNIRTV